MLLVDAGVFIFRDERSSENEMPKEYEKAEENLKHSLVDFAPLEASDESYAPDYAHSSASSENPPEDKAGFEKRSPYLNWDFS